MAYNSTRIIPGSPTPPTGLLPHLPNDLGYNRPPSTSDFQIERNRKPSPTQVRRAMPEPHISEEQLYRESVARLLHARRQLFTVSGSIPVDPTQLVLFFRTKSNITHSLDFPIDVDHSTPPALEVLIAACIPQISADVDDYGDRESLYFPPNLPLTTSLEISNHPILDAVRNTLFPLLPEGHHLTTVRDKLELLVKGGRLGPQARNPRNDGRSATIIVTLPARFRGGALVIRDPDGNEERFNARSGKQSDIEWTAFLADCDYEIENVHRGCRMIISYAVHLRTFGVSNVTPERLIQPSENFLDLVSPILNMSLGRKIAFFTLINYDVNPAEVLAETLVAKLKGSDALLYHALKAYKLSPELHWAAGGYIWPIDKTVEIINDDVYAEMQMKQGRLPPNRAYHGYQPDEGADLRFKVEGSGAVSLVDAEISVLTDWEPALAAQVGQERVPFVSEGDLGKLVVNVLIVTFVPGV